MLDWKEYQGKQHVYWSAFKLEGDAELVKKFKGNGDGYNPKVYGPFELGGFSYAAVQKTGRSGKQYFDIERKQVLGDERPEQTAAKSVAREYENGAKIGHAENVAMHKEMLAAISKLVDAVNANTAAQKESHILLDQIRQHTQAIDKQLVEVLAFRQADKLAKGKSS